MPLPLKTYSTYTLPRQYDSLYRYLTGQPEHIAPPVGSKRVMQPTQGAAAPPPSFAPVNTLSNLNAERQARLQEKLRRLYESYDLETRVEEKMRIKAIIGQTEVDLRGL